jgi:hypothetical protein
VFIAGAGRSGSTLLGDALGQLSGCVHVGEMRFIFEQAGGERTCGCGSPIADCELWQAARSRSFGSGSPPLDLAELAHFSSNGLRYRGPSLLKLRRQAALSVPVGSSAANYAEALRRLYLALADLTGAEVVIDSSKIAMHVHLGARFAGVRSHVVHLVRDPRAIAYSWRRKAVDGVTFGPARVSMSWVASNLAVEALDGRVADSSYTFVRYEDFVRDPVGALELLSDRIGVGGSSLPFVDARTLRLDANHTVAGNPSRFKRGDVQLVPDEEWRSKMSIRDYVLATLPAAPLFRRYSYPLHHRRR